MSLEVTDNKPGSRVARKRRNARERIIREAEALMRSNPVDEVTISQITEAADVGHGTFYLHFKTKYDVLVPIIQAEALRWDAQFQRSFGHLQDPAEVMAFSARYMARNIAGDPLWRWFLKHSGVPVEDMREAIGSFGARDFGRGLMSGRFQVPELTSASSFMFGGFATGLIASLDSENPDAMIDQTIEVMLRVLGLSVDDAREIAHRPLPTLIEIELE